MPSSDDADHDDASPALTCIAGATSLAALADRMKRSQRGRVATPGDVETATMLVAVMSAGLAVLGVRAP
jgi:hypothetical protein